MSSYAEENLISLLFSFFKGNRMENDINIIHLMWSIQYTKQLFLRKQEQ